MNNEIKIQYKLLASRYINMIWTHKIQEKQADLYLKMSHNNKTWMTWMTVLTTTSIFSVILTNFGFDWLLEVITGIFAALSTFFTLRSKDNAWEAKALANKNYAAKCRTIREMYASLMTDVKSGRYESIEEIALKRNELEHLEQMLFENTTAPHTTEKAVKKAEEALKSSKESTTEDEEFRLLLPENLQID